VTTPMRPRMSFCLFTSPGVWWAGFMIRGLMMHAASSAASSAPSADAGLRKYVRDAASAP
jgi:hypothetical protein